MTDALFPLPAHTEEPHIRLYGHQWNECGYCKGKRAALVQRPPDACSKAFHIVVSSSSFLSPAQYEGLVNHGWRRCGVSIYKPDNWTSCCPQISIRLPVAHFQPSKSQRKVLKKMEAVTASPPENQNSLPNDSSTEEPSKKFQKQQRKEGSPSRKTAHHQQQQSSPNAASSTTIVAPEILDTLAQQVQTILQNLLGPSEAMRLLPPSRVQFKVRHQHFSKSSSNDNKQDSTILVVTSVCAAIAGRSRGTLDRGDLCRQVAAALAPTSTTTTTKRSRDDGINNFIQAVEPHIASGQLLVYLSKSSSPSALLQNETNQMDALASNQAPPAAVPMEQDTGTTPTDRLAQWWTRRRRQQQQPETSEDPWKLEVTTLWAHESALDPAVYRLYALYQHQVHGDADPFVEPLPNHNNNRDKSGDHNGNSNNNHNHNDNDPWSEEWGTRAPLGWRTKLKQALGRDFASLPWARQRHLVRHYIQFYEFLVENAYPLQRDNQTTQQKKQHQQLQQGTFHQQYRINGVLIAVGVVDILPQALSSVYVFYDPDFCQNVAPLGKYTVLREIQWAQEHKLPYYYLGYYIESCVKMKYKADYAPSDLLCPRHAVWVPAAQAQHMIREQSPERHCCTFASTEEEMADTDSGTPIPPHLQLEIGLGRLVTWQELPPEATSVLEPFVRDFCNETGSALAEQFVLDFR